ncbi:MAG: calcium-binding protein [Phycisphaerales bacterium JB063]
MTPIRIRTRFLLRTLACATPVALVLAASTPLVADLIEGDDNDNPNLIGTQEDDTINGHGGNDVIHAHGGNDTVDGGDGNDEIWLGDGDDISAGREGQDTIHGQDGVDTIAGGGGHDTITGGYGDDQLYGEGGNDNINGGVHDDFIDGGGGDDTLESGGGGGIIHGHAGNDTITLTGSSWGPAHHGYPAWDDPDFDFQRIVAEAYGDDGDDYIKSSPGIAGWGGSFQYIHAGVGKDVVEGGNGQDLLIVQGGDDIIITGPYEDYIAIIGNSVEGYTFYDTLHYLPDGSVEADENGNPIDYNNGTDMLCFVRDVNPDQLTMISVWLSGSTKHFMEYDTGLPTRDAVNLNLNDHPMLKNIEAYRTGDGHDTLVDTDYGGPDDPATAPSYVGRLRGEQPAVTLYGHDPDNMAWLNLHHLFFTGAGNDTITLGRGNDLVDAGSGNDTIYVGPDNCFIMTGPGRDTVHFPADSLDGTDSPNPDGGKTRISDMASGDTIVLEGVQANTVTFEAHTMPDNRGGGLAGLDFTSVMVDGEEQFVILLLNPNQLQATAQGGNTRITVRGRVTDPASPVGPVLEGATDRADNAGRAPEGAENLPEPGGDRDDRGGRGR